MTMAFMAEKTIVVRGDHCLLLYQIGRFLWAYNFAAMERAQTGISRERV
jgi:hypothetical protein